MQEYIDWFIENTPAWLVITIGILVGLLKMGPKFFMNWMDVAARLREKSDKIRNEYITLLEDENKRLKKKLKDLDEESH